MDYYTTHEAMLGLSVPSASHTPSSPSLQDQLQCLKQQIDEIQIDMRNLEQREECFVLVRQEKQKVEGAMEQIRGLLQTPQTVVKLSQLKENKDSVINWLQKEEHCLVQFRMKITELFKETTKNLSKVAGHLKKELSSWQRKQQLAGNSGEQTNIELDYIQGWCETLAVILWQNRQQVKELIFLKQRLPLESCVHLEVLHSLENTLTKLLTQLVKSTFVIEEQPTQVIKTNTKFTTTVRLLVGSVLNVHMSPPKVKVSIVCEPQANGIFSSGGAVVGEVSGEMINNIKEMQFNQQTKHITASFKNLLVKKIKRSEKRGDETVMEEKFALCFQTQFTIGGEEPTLKFRLWALSLPMVVIVHANQEPHAWATVFWDNAFAQAGRAPFQVPDKVIWSEAACALNIKFQSAVGRSLTEENLKFLGGKALRQTANVDCSHMYLSWSQFNKETLLTEKKTNKKYTFWDWFYAAMKLTKDYLLDLWNDGAIIGFTWKKDIEKILSASTSGNFILRFSDSVIGGLAIAFVDENRKILMLHPSSSKELDIRGLADRVSDYNTLVYLYPNIPKEAVFQKYYTPKVNTEAAIPGYVMPYIKSHIPNDRSTSPTGSLPICPSLGEQNSPTESPVLNSSYENNDEDMLEDISSHSELQFLIDSLMEDYSDVTI